MESAFWDSSSVVPLCIRQPATQVAKTLGERLELVVSWFTPVEVRGGMARLLRTGQITPNQQVQGLVFLDDYRADWREIRPTDSLREKAEGFVERFPLRAADALQLASAWTWCQGQPRGRPFVSGDTQLLSAAQELGFNAIRA